MHAPAAPAPAAPQPTSTGPAQRRSVSLTAAETTGPAEDDLCPAQLGYTPLRPLYPQRQTTQRGPAQQHLLQWRQPAQQTIDTANHRPAQQRPCGRDNRPGQLHLSKSTPPLCSPFVATAQTIQPWTIVKHPGRTMGYTSYSLFSAPPTLLAKMESLEPEWHGRVTQNRRASPTVKNHFQKCHQRLEASQS